MTREEAIRILKEHKIMFQHDFGWDISTIKALDMAISVLSADGEYIKKEDTIEYLNDLFGEMCHVSFDNVIQSVDSLQTYSFLGSAENKGEWIPVSERLPEDGRYLCTYETEFGDCVDFGKFYKGDWFVGRVTAWQPLPEPYKGE